MNRPDLAVLRGRLPPSPLTRFAPAPTGYLHLGHAVSAIYVWGLARALGGRVLLRMRGGFAPPVYLHHPLVRRPSGEKLSKSGRDTGLRELRVAGWSPEEVLGEAAHRAGLLPQARPLAAGDLAGLFGPGGTA